MKEFKIKDSFKTEDFTCYEVKIFGKRKLIPEVDEIIKLDNKEFKVKGREVLQKCFDDFDENDDLILGDILRIKGDFIDE